MSEYDFILDNMKWSYSSANSYLTCKGGFKLAYIDVEDRINNAFSDYGNLVHETLEKYFKGELEEYELLGYYEDNFDSFVENPFPAYPSGMRENYYKSGAEFFENFKFDKELYDLIFIEDFINAEYHGIKLSVKPDLIIREKSTRDCFLIDYKTAKMKSGKAYKEQIEEYKRQFLLYVQFLWTEKDIEIKKLKIWFIRDQKEVVIDVDPMEVFNTMEWFEDTINKIKNEEDWEFNDSKENAYFCQNICSLRNICPKFN